MLGNFCVEGMHFHAFHGDLEVERELGQVFSIDISLSYEITKQCMDQSSSSSLRGADIYDHIKSIVMVRGINLWMGWLSLLRKIFLKCLLWYRRSK